MSAWRDASSMQRLSWGLIGSEKWLGFFDNYIGNSG
jgi:hypothetical protein